jgi:hypothetical protein
MGVSCGTHGNMSKAHWFVCLEERGHSENLGVDGRVTLKWIVGK